VLLAPGAVWLYQTSYSIYSSRLVMYHTVLGVTRGVLEAVFFSLWGYQVLSLGSSTWCFVLSQPAFSMRVPVCCGADRVLNVLHPCLQFQKEVHRLYRTHPHWAYFAAPRNLVEVGYLLALLTA
jgi:hypothetical protein